MPQFLLKNFSDKKKRIWVFDKWEDRVFRTNIRNVAAERKFYDFEDGSNCGGSLEEGLSKIESECRKALKNVLRDGSIAHLEPADRGAIAVFASLQFLRTKAWREDLGELIEQLHSWVKGGFWRVEGSFEAGQGGASGGLSAKSLHLELIGKVDKYFQHFLSKDWLLIEAPRSSPIWVSDNPVTLQNQIVKSEGVWGNLGLGIRGIEIYLPISHRFSLAFFSSVHKQNIVEMRSKLDSLKGMGVDVGEDREERVANLEASFFHGRPLKFQNENVKNLNSLQVISSKRFLFSENDQFELAYDMIRSNAALRRPSAFKVG